MERTLIYSFLDLLWFEMKPRKKSGTNPAALGTEQIESFVFHYKAPTVQKYLQRGDWQ